MRQVLCYLSQEQQQQLNRLTMNYVNIFGNPNEKLTFTTKVKGRIRTTTVYSKHYPDKQLLIDGIIRLSRKILRFGLYQKNGRFWRKEI